MPNDFSAVGYGLLAVGWIGLVSSVSAHREAVWIVNNCLLANA